MARLMRAPGASAWSSGESSKLPGATEPEKQAVQTVSSEPASIGDQPTSIPRARSS